jgi:hypothetical protein
MKYELTDFELMLSPVGLFCKSYFCRKCNDHSQKKELENKWDVSTFPYIPIFWNQILSMLSLVINIQEKQAKQISEFKL